MPLSGFTAPNTPPGTPPTTTNTGGGSLDGFNAPTPESQKIYGLNQQQQGYDQAAQQASSFYGMWSNAAAAGRQDIDAGVAGIGDELSQTAGMVKDIGQNTWQTYQQTPAKIMNDIQEAQKNLAQSYNDPTVGAGFLDLGKALYKGGGRTALDFANAVFAPLSAAIGSAVKSSGAQQLEDNLGNVIADKSGITDNKAFQQFAVTHPNFGDDFQRAMTGYMAGEETGKIDPKQMVSDIKTMADNLVSRAKPPVDAAPPEEPGTPEEETKAPTKVPVNSTLEFNRGTGANPMLKSAFEANFNSEPTLGQTLNQAGTTAQPLDGFDTSGVRVQAPTVPTEPTIPQDATPGQMQTAKLSSDIANQIGQQFGDLPQYKTMNMADQASQALKLMEDDPIGAKAVAMGEKSAPGDLREGSVFTAVKAKALADGDTQTLIDLSHSKLATEASELGQRIKAYDSGANAGEDPVKILSDIQKTREDTFQKVNKKSSADVKAKDVNDIDQEVKKNTPKKADWKDFISSLQCK